MCGGGIALCVEGLPKNRFTRCLTGQEQCAETLRLPPSPPPHQGLRRGERGNHFQIKGINCLESATLKYSLWPCPHGKNDSKLIKQDQRLKRYDESLTHHSAARATVITQ